MPGFQRFHAMAVRHVVSGPRWRFQYCEIELTTSYSSYAMKYDLALVLSRDMNEYE